MHLQYALWLHFSPLTPKKKKDVFSYFSTCQCAYEASESAYILAGLNLQDIQKLISSKRNLQVVEDTIDRCNTLNIHILSIEDPSYPYLLKQLEDSPIVLFTEGNLSILNMPSIAIVGARKCSEYGYHTAYHFGEQLAKSGINVVSGVALGIDAAAHEGALQSGSSTGVIGAGNNIIYPKENTRVYHSLRQKGCIISEYSPDTSPLPFHFPQRNRIISGLCTGILIVEAAKRSGSLITAELALQQNKDVFSIPGDICRPLSQGTNHLITQGAKLVQSVEDILEEIPVYIKQNMTKTIDNDEIYPFNTLDKVEFIVYDCLSWQPISFEHIANQLNMPIIQTASILLKLEIKGFIQRLPGERYVRLN